MPPILAPFVLMWMLARQLFDLFKTPHYRAILYWMLLLLLSRYNFLQPCRRLGNNLIRSTSLLSLWPQLATVI